MYINVAIIEKLEYNGTLKSIELKSSRKVRELVVAFVDEYQDPRSGPFHFMEIKYEDEYNKKMKQAKSRRLGAGFFTKEGNEYVFKTQWAGIPTKRLELSYYALMLPNYAIPISVNIYDPLSNNTQYKRSVKRDDFNKCFIIYIECKSSKGVFNFNLECSFIVDNKRFYCHEYIDEKTERYYGDVELPDEYEKEINIKTVSLADSKVDKNNITNTRTISLEEDKLMNNTVQYISPKEVEILKNKVKTIIMTATDIEKETVFKYLQPLPECEALKVDTTTKQTYTIGVLGKYPVIHVQTNMGSTSSDGSILTTKDVLDYWKPKAIIMPGICFGKDMQKQKIGDILISEFIVEYDNSKIKNGHEIPRGSIVRSGLTLFNRFKNCIGWKYLLEDGSEARIINGRLLSGSKLVDDKEFKRHLFELFPEAIGGEMEGSGVYAASFHESFNEWILVKGICDWAENKESEDKDKNQRIAVEAAVSLCHHVLLNPYALKALDVESINDINLKETTSKVSEEAPQAKNTTIFNGPVYGAINTGSGNIHEK